MRKHGWELPYHPLQVVAVAVFLALGFAFYVFFAPFVGKQLFQWIVMAIYTPLLVSAFGLYIWCAASDPADPGVFKSKKYAKIGAGEERSKINMAKCGGESANEEGANGKGRGDTESAIECRDEPEKNNPSSHKRTCFPAMVALLPCAYICDSHDEASDQHSEDGMFYCSLCEVEVYKYSKHCRVCDKCVDRFDHHCRWLNNCIGRRNYRKFFTLMVSALLLLIIQWSTGILVLILCFLERKQFETDISSKLGSSFTIVPFVIVVAVCTILAMIATLPLCQLFFFHILLIKKGISTYDYIIALREQEQQGAGCQQSPQMSPVSSITGLSSASSFNTFHRGAWCTPPRLFVEDQFDVVPPDNGSVSSRGKRSAVDEQMKKKNPAAVKISPWMLARLNTEDVSKAAAEARKKSKILRPVARHEPSYNIESHETDSSFGSSSRRISARPDSNKKRWSRRIRLPADVPLSTLPNLDPQNGIDRRIVTGTSSSTFGASRGVPVLGGIIPSSPESSLDSPDVCVSSLRTDEASRFVGLSGPPAQDIPLSRSTSDGYEASGGEDSDQIPTRILHRSSNWSNLLFGAEADRTISRSIPPFASSSSSYRKH
ncbi:probable protein S-acyltransferase 22 isoform X2 [Andrographis paniculata]|uniref:probable protein S-acyltransferase 22 isoform X2 n=1 Tax=Andrographis paniculata TaxID=175694 RepID=UPI0021E927A9|nr:probable protein S-acyltransferase 22 isoform X2 [Andrographis paniculata]